MLTIVKIDIVAHVLWAYIIFPDSEYKILALIFAIIPDVTAALPFTIYATLTGKIKKIVKDKKGLVPVMPSWMLEIYKYLHSIPLILLVTALLFIFNVPYIIILMISGSWLFHVVTDIFLHDDTYITTPFLYPFSKYTFQGINWAEKKFLITNYTLIIIALLIKFAI